MYAVESAAKVTAVGNGESGGRAQRVKGRRQALGMTISDLAREAEVNRGQLGEYEAGKHHPSEPWVRKIENTLDRLEHLFGDDGADEPERPNLIRIKVEGVYGAKALIVEGSPEDQGTLEAMVDRIMRNLRGDEPQEPTNS